VDVQIKYTTVKLNQHFVGLSYPRIQCPNNTNDCKVYSKWITAAYQTDERESPQEALPARENSSLGFIEAVQVNCSVVLIRNDCKDFNVTTVTCPTQLHVT